MAASDSAHDFSHLLLQDMAAHTNRPVEMDIQSIVDFEQHAAQFDLTVLQQYRTLSPDLIIVRIGDNVPPSSSQVFQPLYASLLRFVNPSGSAYVIATSSWYPNPSVDTMMRVACLAASCHYVDLSDLIHTATNRVSSERDVSDINVASHPGDKGMRAIEQRLWPDIESWLDQGQRR